MEAADSIREILGRRKLSHEDLGDLMGVNRVQIGRYLTGETFPAAGGCLVLAGLSENAAERRFWMDQSKLKPESFEVIGKAIGAARGEKITSGDERELLDWWRNPCNPMEEGIKTVVETMLKNRE